MDIWNKLKNRISTNTQFSLMFSLMLACAIGGGNYMFYKLSPEGKAASGNHVLSSGEAMYLAGEFCMINAELSRSTKDMLLDFNKCAKLHEKWQQRDKEE